MQTEHVHSPKIPDLLVKIKNETLADVKDDLKLIADTIRENDEKPKMSKNLLWFIRASAGIGVVLLVKAFDLGIDWIKNNGDDQDKSFVRSTSGKIVFTFVGTGVMCIAVATSTLLCCKNKRDKLYTDNIELGIQNASLTKELE